MKGSLIILGFFALGIALGVSNTAPDWLVKTDYSQYALYVLMFLVGVGIGSDSNALKAIGTMNFKVLLIPITTILGTALGVALIAPLLSGISIKEAMAVGAGYGYYSLSSIIIKEMHSEWLGVVALLSNVIREVTTLLMAPLFALYFGKIAPICSGGATSMDTTLPIISQSSGKEYAIASLIHGIVLTVLVPFIVSLLLSI
ncbi:MAG: lysine exporter LysO family protein [Bacteroidales bacterium]|nr:lysine exporter LysO family protein [Bacteroidales bacterium]